MKPLQRYSHRAGLHFAGLAITKVASVVVFVFVARTLLPVKFGLYAFWLTIGMLLVYFSDIGLTSWFQTEAHHQPPMKLFQKIFQLRLLTAGLVMGLGIAWWLGNATFTLAVLLHLLTYVLAESLLTISEGWHFHHGNVAAIAIKNIGKIVIIGLGYFWLQKTYSLEIAVMTTAAASVLMAIWFVPWKVFKNWIWLDIKEVWLLLRKASHYSILQLTSYVYSRGDSLVVQHVLGAAALGLYSAAYRILETVSLLPTAVMQTLFPIAAQPGKVTPAHLWKLVPVMTVGGLFVAVGCWLFGPQVLVLLLGPAYEPASHSLRVFAGVMLLFFVNAPLAAVVQSSSIVKRFLPWGIANTILNIILNLIFIPQFGILAAAWVMLTTEFTGLLINIYFTKMRYAKTS